MISDTGKHDVYGNILCIVMIVDDGLQAHSQPGQPPIMLHDGFVSNQVTWSQGKPSTVLGLHWLLLLYILYSLYYTSSIYSLSLFSLFFYFLYSLSLLSLTLHLTLPAGFLLNMIRVLSENHRPGNPPASHVWLHHSWTHTHTQVSITRNMECER